MDTAKWTTISVSKETLAKLRKLAKKRFEVQVSVQAVLTYLIEKDGK